MAKRAFTLLELLLVIFLMGFLGTFMIAGFRQSYRGMAERGAIGNADQFVRAAYQRAQIDRHPVLVEFWNETYVTEEDEKATIKVVGKARSVRYFGRLSQVDLPWLVDEFNDLKNMRFVDLSLGPDASEEDQESSRPEPVAGDGYNIFLMDGVSGGGKSLKKTMVTSTTCRYLSQGLLLDSREVVPIENFAYQINDNASDNYTGWKAGNAYGMEATSFQLPENFIFGEDYSHDTSAPVREIAVLKFMPTAISGSGAGSGGVDGAMVKVSNIRPDASGKPTVYDVGTIKDPSDPTGGR